MKHRKRRKGSARRFLSILLAVVMVLSLAPENMLTLAAHAEETDAGLCEHHTEHTADCGYREAAPCTHEHTDECYTEKTSCIHVHNADCYGGELPAEGEDREADACTHVCTEDSGCITKELNCTHEHDGSCGYAETAPCSYVCEICNGEETDEGQETPESVTGGDATEENKAEEDTTEENKAEEDTIEESDTEESVSENGTPKEDIPVEGTAAEEGLCPHHGQHTEDCGYGETTPCGYVCKICPVQELIDALPDGSEITAENAERIREQLSAIDDAKAELTDEELDTLDTARYEAAVSALLTLEGMEGANEPELLANPTTIDISQSDAIIEETKSSYIITGTTTEHNIRVRSGVTATITLRDVNIDVSSHDGRAAFCIVGASGGNVTVNLEGTNILKSGSKHAGMEKGDGHGILIINGPGSLEATGGANGAGIGSGLGTTGTGVSCENVTITGGTIVAHGGANSAGIGGCGGGKYGYSLNIKIRGGHVTATGANGADGIGRGTKSSEGCSFSTETSGSAWINASSIRDNDDTSGWHGVIFQGNAGQVYGDSYTLTANAEIPTGATLTIGNGQTLTIANGATLTNNGTITNNGGTLTIQKGGSITGGAINGTGGIFQTENLTEDMIPNFTGLVYDGQDQTDAVTQATTLSTVDICGQAFTLSGWTHRVTKNSDLKYTVTYTPTDGGTAITKTVTLGQSDTAVQATATKKEYTYGETISINATAKATGAAPTAVEAPAMLTASFTAPTVGQMAVYRGGEQVSAAVSAAHGQQVELTVDSKTLGVGEHTLTVKYTASDSMAAAESETFTVTVKPAELKISGATLAEKTYDGTKTATVTGVTFDGILSGGSLTMGENGDYTATAQFTDENAGTGKTVTVTVTLKNENYSLKEKTFKITDAEIKPRTLAADEITVAVTPSSYEYTGGAIIPGTVKATYTEDGKEIEVPDSEYSVAYTNNTKVGRATVTVSDAKQNEGNYELADATATFEITAVSISQAEVTVKGDYTYNGKAQTPDENDVTVTLNGKKLTEGTDYTFAVTDNVNAGTATVTVTGTGNYKDTATGAFAIAQVPLTVTAKDQSITYGGSIAQGTDQVKIEGLAGDDMLESVTLTASSSEVETKNKTITPAAAVINSGGTDVTTNYDITYVAGSLTIGKAAGRVISDLTGTQTNDWQKYTYTITPTEGAVYRMGESGEWTKAGQENANIFTGITPGTNVTFFAKMPENENYEEGDAKSITVTFEKLTPAAPALSYMVDRTASNNVKITITHAPGAEYSFDGGSTWGDANEQDCFNSSQTVTLAIRLKETDTHKESPVQKVTVNLAKKDRKSPPKFDLQCEPNGDTDYTVTIPPTEGCEYSFDGLNWSDNNVKTGVAVGEIVTGYKRYKETNEYNASGAVSDTETMPKFTVKTPVISPAGGTYTGSVSVTITCGTSGAQIYYTTDGSTPTGSSARYTGAFTVTPTATVRAIAIKEGLEASAVATASYTKPGGSSSGGGDSNDDNDSGNESNGSGQETGGGDGGNTAPAAPAATPAATNPGTGTTSGTPGAGTTATPATPGTGNTAGPGSQTKPGNGNTAGPGNSDTQESSTDTEKPFLRDETGKEGWDVIKAETEKAEEGCTVTVEMNGSVVVPGSVLESVKGKDIDVVFDMGNGMSWSVNGRSVTADQIGDIDFSVKTGTDTIPVDIINNVTGESYSIQLSLAHEGEFGFTAALSVNLGRENVGRYATLYYYNRAKACMEFVCEDRITEDGTAKLPFTHASEYAIVVDEKPAQENGEVSVAASASGEEGNTGETPDPAGQETGAAWEPWLFVAIGAVVIIIGIGAWIILRKKKEEDR